MRNCLSPAIHSNSNLKFIPFLVQDNLHGVTMYMYVVNVIKQKKLYDVLVL